MNWFGANKLGCSQKMAVWQVAERTQNNLTARAGFIKAFGKAFDFT